VTLTNTGTNAVSVSGVSFSQPIFSETDNCTAPMPANGTCVIQVTATPLQPGNFFGTMTIAFADAAKNQILTVSGVAYLPITTLVSSLDFGGSTAVGSASTAQYIEIANSMQPKPQAYTASVTDDFVVDTSKCPSPVPGYWGRPLYVTFKPKSAGLHTGILTLSFPGVSAAETITLTGSSSGSTGPVDSVPPSLDFGSVLLSTSVTQSVSVANIGQQLLHVTGISITGTNAADFSAATGQCAAVAPGAKCSLQISFHPPADVSQSVQLSLQDDSAGSPHTVALTGKGLNPVTWATPPSSTTATTTSGDTASYSLNLTSGAPATDTVKVSCNGAPQYATCIPTPSSLTLTPVQTAPISVSIATNNATAASAKKVTPFNRATLAFIIFLPLLSLSRRHVWKMAAMGAVIFITTAFSGCGGTSTVTPPATTNARTTGPGTYVLQVVARDGTYTQTQKITLIVQ
jgi:hypothetical protein